MIETMSDIINSRKRVIEDSFTPKTSIQRKLDAIISLFGSDKFTKSEFLSIVSDEKIDIFIAELYLKHLIRNRSLYQIKDRRYRNSEFL